MTARSACGSALSPYVSCVAHPATKMSAHMVAVESIVRDIRPRPRLGSTLTANVRVDRRARLLRASVLNALLGRDTRTLAGA